MAVLVKCAPKRTGIGSRPGTSHLALSLHGTVLLRYTISCHTASHIMLTDCHMHAHTRVKACTHAGAQTHAHACTHLSHCLHAGSLSPRNFFSCQYLPWLLILYDERVVLKTPAERVFVQRQVRARHVWYLYALEILRHRESVRTVQMPKHTPRKCLRTQGDTLSRTFLFTVRTTMRLSAASTDTCSRSSVGAARQTKKVCVRSLPENCCSCMGGYECAK